MPHPAEAIGDGVVNSWMVVDVNYVVAEDGLHLLAMVGIELVL